jgi:hypothetical protein
MHFRTPTISLLIDTEASNNIVTSQIEQLFDPESEIPTVEQAHAWVRRFRLSISWLTAFALST